MPLALQASTSSLRLFQGLSARTTTTPVSLSWLQTGTTSLTAKVEPGCTARVVKVGRLMKPMVRPSGLALTSSVQPILPSPPGRLLMMRVLPTYFSAWDASRRAPVSVPEPAL